MDDKKFEIRKARRQRILEAAKTVFNEKGYTRTQVKDIARAAHISVGAVYLYFKSKEELALASLELGTFQGLYPALSIFSETRRVAERN